MAFTLRDAVEMYASVAGEPFTLGAVTSAVQVIFPGERELSPRVREMLDETPSLFHGPGGDTYLPRATFFQGARFLVIPTELEVELSILVTGHRLIPFCSPEILPSRAAIHTPSGQKIRRKRIAVQPRQIAPFISLYGIDGMRDYLLADSPENAGILGEAGAKALEADQVHLVVYWMKDVYEEIGFTSETALRSP